MEKKSKSPLAWVLILSGVFFALFLLISGVLYIRKATLQMNGHVASSSFFGGGGYVGVLEMSGIILDSKKTLNKLDKLERDDRIQAVVLRLNSPGGAVAPSQEIYEAVRQFKKPLVVSMGSVAASGAYWIACGAKKVYANPGTLTGSIGVIMQFANLQRLYDWAKVERYSVKSGPFKDAGAEYRKMSPEEQLVFQNMVTDILVQFRKVVATGRQLSPTQVTAVSDGRVFTGNQAKQLGLVDELGTIKDAVQEAAKMAGIKGKPDVLYLDKQKHGLLDFFLNDTGDDEAGTHSQAGVLNAVSLLLKIAGLETRDKGTDPSVDFVPGVYSILGN